jgi:FAD-dependent urate hydroxylase
MPVTTCQVAVIGAGPYGLAATAHLRAGGVETRLFGEVMEFWQHQMPSGMLLRSSWDASHIADPHHHLTLDQYQATVGVQLSTPIPLDDFVKYGHWFQRQAAPDLDRRKVAQLIPSSSGFRLALEDGEQIQAQHVVIAAGIAPFAYRPPQFDGLPPSLASHSSDHRDLGGFAGRQVIVVGGGQSAIETAVLLCEAQADVEVIIRAPQLRWLRRSASLHKLPGSIRGLLYPPTDVGPPGLNQIVARPDLFKQLPLELQHRIAYRSIRPAASGWLLPRATRLRITTGRSITSAVPIGERLEVMLDDGSRRTIDHVLVATGYRVNISRYAFLAPDLVRSLRQVNGYPLLSAGFESSVPGLHFIGAPAACSFGPLMRFVSGGMYAARALTSYILSDTSGRMKGGRSWLIFARSSRDD